MGLQNNIHASEKTVYKIGTTAFLLSASAYFIRYLISDDFDESESDFNKVKIVDCDVPKSNARRSLYPAQSCFSFYENDPLVIIARAK